ncbi:MAG: TonB-dependent receptor [Dysgonamonadaceae bacterium]|jgi:TonB-linked SusC/RagA family outer membrane protein|nr:TonB-dependent receptor [Dysgonamonadaceae bacterium]
MKKKSNLIKLAGVILLLFALPLGILAQTITVQGTVVDTTGDPIIGATVIETGTTNGVVTDYDGNYTIRISPQGTLTVSYIGYTSQVIGVQSRTRIDIVLHEDQRQLEEVVVVGYGTQRREAVTGSVASMRGDVLREVQTGNVTTALAGRVAGVQMQQTSARPGADMQIRIRGTRSFSADNNPLIVLDGIPFAGTIGDISPDDIRSVDILKDASATAIYGARGANGVIIITTNRGNVGQSARVTYNTYIGAKTLFNRFPMMTGDELYELRRVAGRFAENIPGGGTRPQMGPDEVIGMNTDWQDLMYKNAIVTSHDISVSGGTERGSYNIGLGYFKDESLMPGQDYTRISLRAAIDQSVGNHIRVGLSSNNNRNVTNGQNLGTHHMLATSPLINPWNEDGSWKTIVSSVADNVWARSRAAIEGLGDRWADNQRGFATYNSLYGEVQIPGVEGLRYRMNIGLNLRALDRGQYQGEGVFSETPTAASTGSLSKSLMTQWVVENVISYDRSFGNHNLNVVGLFSSEETNYDRSLVSAINIPSDHFQYWNLGQAHRDDITVDPNQQHRWASGLQSYMARVMYDYDRRYMLSLAVRSDASSRLAKGHQWHTYPAVSIGWNLGREAFMENVEWQDEIKFRFGSGRTSNQAVQPYATLGRLTSRPYNFGSQTEMGFFVGEVPNPGLGWEHSTTYNAGLDFALFRSRLQGTIEYYSVNTNDILMQVPLPQTSGVGSYWANVGKSQNRGVEISLNGIIIENLNGWSWAAGLNFYTNNNKVIALSTGQRRETALSLFVDYPINSIFDYERTGLWQEGDPHLNILEPGGNVGMIKVRYTGDFDANGMPVRAIGVDDRQVISADPNWLGGFNTRVAYKNWDLNVIGTYQNGGILVSSLHATNGFLNMLTGRRGNVAVDYWTPENTGAKYPKPGGIQSGDNPKYGSTMGYFDASYLKVGQITLGYSFDRNAAWMTSLGLNNLRLYGSVQNPFVLFSPFKRETGLDPVTNAFGDDTTAAAVTTSLPYRASTMLTVGTSTPQTRNFVFGLSVSF